MGAATFGNPIKTDSSAVTLEPESISLPERSLSDWGVALLLFLLSFLYLWPLRNYCNLNADEGIVLQGAQRILQGEVLYRDFFSFLTPGSYYWMAILFRVFGSSLLVGRTVLLIYGGLFSVLTYLLARRLCSRWSSILAAYLLLVVCLPLRFLTLHNWDSTFWALLALYCAVWLLQAPHWAWAFGTGSFMALTFLFEQSKGTGIVFGLCLGFLIATRNQRCRNFLTPQHIMSLVGGLTWPFLLTVGYFASQHSFSQMLGGWFWPLRHYSVVNRMPYGYINLPPEAWEAFYGSASWIRRMFFVLVTSPMFIVPALPVLALGIMTYHAIGIWRKKEQGMASSYYVLVCAGVLGLVLSAVATGRPEHTHLMHLAPPFFVVLAWIVEGRGFRSPLLTKVQPLVVVCLLVSFTAVGMILIWNPLNAHQILKTRRGLLRSSYSDPVLEYVEAHVPPGEKMFVYPYQPLYNFLTATLSPTRYEYFQPGMHTSSQFQEAITQVNNDRTRTILYDPSFSEKIPRIWPATPLSVLVTDPLRDFIFSRYRPCRALASENWQFVFMIRKDLPCPGEAPRR